MTFEEFIEKVNESIDGIQADIEAAQTEVAAQKAANAADYAIIKTRIDNISNSIADIAADIKNFVIPTTPQT